MKTKLLSIALLLVVPLGAGLGSAHQQPAQDCNRLFVPQAQYVGTTLPINPGETHGWYIFPASGTRVVEVWGSFPGGLHLHVYARNASQQCSLICDTNQGFTGGAGCNGITWSDGLIVELTNTGFVSQQYVIDTRPQV